MRSHNAHSFCGSIAPLGIDKFPQELYKSYRNYLMKRYYAFFHVFFLMEITKTEKKSHVFAVAPHAGAWIEIVPVRKTMNYKW